jgi:hypothetical protein
VSDVWNEALRRGAPANALAVIYFVTRKTTSYPNGPPADVVPTWSFVIMEGKKQVFSMELPDHCSPPARRRRGT